MKKKVLKNVGLLFFVGCLSFQLSAQTALAAGDAAFVGFSNTNVTKSLSLLLLKNIDSSTEIAFTNRSVSSTAGTGWSNNFGVDDIWTLTTSAAYTAGTIITLNCSTSPPTATTVKTTGNGVEQVSAGTLVHTDAGTGTDDDFDFTNGDTFFAYQGVIATASWIAGISSHPNNGSGNTATAIPTTLTTANAFLKLFAGGTGATNGIAAAVYSKTLVGSATELRTSINNSIQGADLVAPNWTRSTTNPSPYKFWAYNVSVNYPTAIGAGDIGSTNLFVADFQSANTIGVYPNPVKNQLTINASSTIDATIIYDILGKPVLSSVNSNSIDVSALNSGTYIVKVILDNGSSSTKKIIKE
ncbi:T9SS type A sorting domain-containing protein [Flavobacterium sp.]|uniref:T9SS type A sorting domain-containing protein n=1 Tax=Flavobacterium sp. TaxID=239 RepID=UPI003C44E2C9